MMFPLASRRRAEDLLLEGKKSYHIQLFSGVEHGWAVRGNPEVENERKYFNYQPRIGYDNFLQAGRRRNLLVGL